MGKRFCLIAALLFSLLLASHGQSAPSAPNQGAKAPSAKAAAAPAAKEDWRQKWDAATSEARKEGSVRLYTMWGPGLRDLLTQRLKERYHIDLEVMPFARGADLVAKVEAEKRAGLKMADFFGIGSSTLVTTMKPMGLLSNIEPLLILPEVKDSGSWQGGRFPFIDKDKTTIGMGSVVQRYILINTNLVKPGEIKEYKDLLKPQYKGKIAMGDPSIPGAPDNMMTHLAWDIWNMEEAGNFLRQLITQQAASIQRDHSLVVDWVARGKMSIGLAGNREAIAKYLALGAPISVIPQKEGHAVSPSAACIGIPTEPAHPNATMVFLNWLLSKEGQTLFTKGFGYPTTRLGISHEGIDPDVIAKPGEKLFAQSEETILFGNKVSAMSKKIIAETAKQ